MQCIRALLKIGFRDSLYFDDNWIYVFKCIIIFFLIDFLIDNVTQTNSELLLVFPNIMHCQLNLLLALLLR